MKCLVEVDDGIDEQGSFRSVADNTRTSVGNGTQLGFFPPCLRKLMQEL